MLIKPPRATLDVPTRRTIRTAIPAAVAVATIFCLSACGSTGPASQSESTSSLTPGSSANTTLGGSGNGKVGVFKIAFTVTGYYRLSGKATVAGNENTCAQMVQDGNTSGAGVWSTPWGGSVTADGHSISEISTDFNDYSPRSTKSGAVFQHSVENSTYITVDNNTFDATGEGGSGQVSVNANGSGSLSFQNAPDQDLSGPSGQMARVSGSVTWTCQDVPASEAPPTGN